MKEKCEREVAQLRLTLSYPMDCSLLGSSVYGIFQARVLEWGAIAFSESELRCAISVKYVLDFKDSIQKAMQNISLIYID